MVDLAEAPIRARRAFAVKVEAPSRRRASAHARSRAVHVVRHGANRAVDAAAAARSPRGSRSSLRPARAPREREARRARAPRATRAHQAPGDATRDPLHARTRERINGEPARPPRSPPAARPSAARLRRGARLERGRSARPAAPPRHQRAVASCSMQKVDAGVLVEGRRARTAAVGHYVAPSIALGRLAARDARLVARRRRRGAAAAPARAPRHRTARARARCARPRAGVARDGTRRVVRRGARSRLADLDEGLALGDSPRLTFTARRRGSRCVTTASSRGARSSTWGARLDGFAAARCACRRARRLTSEARRPVPRRRFRTVREQCFASASPAGHAAPRAALAARALVARQCVRGRRRPRAPRDDPSASSRERPRAPAIRLAPISTTTRVPASRLSRRADVGDAEVAREQQPRRAAAAEAGARAR